MAATAKEKLRVGTTLIAIACWIVSCATNTNDSEFQLFRVEAPEGEIGLVFEHEKITRDQKNSEKTKERDIDFREELSMDTRGSIYHPKLFQFDLSGTFGLTQSKRTSDTFDEDESRKIQGLGFLGTILKDHPYSADLFGDIRSDRINREFAEDLFNELERYGARLRFRNDFVPLTLQFEDQQIDTESSTESFVTTNRNYLAAASHMTDESETAVSYSFTETTETRENRDYDTDEFNASNRYMLDEKGHFVLTSVARIFDQTGDVIFRNIDLTELLLVKHSESLESNYQYRLDLRQTMEERSDRHTLTAGVTHKLYDSLRTRLEVEGFTEKITDKEGNADGVDDEIRNRLDLQYKKEIPGGKLFVNAGWMYELNDEDFNATTRRIIDESITLADIEIVLLDNRRIDRTTVVVSDDTGTVFYIEGTDYSLHLIGDLLEIRRIAGGLINDGDRLLVDYTFSTDPSLQYATTTQNYGVRANLCDLFTPYFRITRRSNDLWSGNATTRLETLDQRIYGIEFEYDGFRIRQEFEDHDSSTLPFRSALSEASFQTTFGPHTFWSVTANNRVTKFGSTPEDRTRERALLFSISSKLKTRLTDNTALEVSGGWRRDKRKELTNRLLDFTSEFLWTVGALTFEVGLTLEKEQEGQTDKNRSYFFTKLTREF